MDEVVIRSLAKWPHVPAVYGWLELDRRGNWRIKGEKIANNALREFIARNYSADEKGRWFFQNGPQRVYVTLAYTPWVLHFQGEQLFDHCGRAVSAAQTWIDDEGSVLMRVENGVGLLDDRDLARYVDEAERLPRLARAEVEARFGFVSNPKTA